MATGNDLGGKISIAIGFDRKMFSALNDLAEHEDHSFAAMVRLLVRDALALRRTSEHSRPHQSTTTPEK